jgi:hypothetical protein
MGLACLRETARLERGKRGGAVNGRAATRRGAANQSACSDVQVLEYGSEKQ